MRSRTPEETIVQYYIEAVNNATVDPPTSVNKVRKGSEAICKRILDLAHIRYEGEAGLWKLMETIREHHLWPDSRMNPIMKSLQQIANYGSHDNSAPYVRADIVPCILEYQRLIYYFLGNDTELPEFDPGNLKNMDAVPRTEDFRIAYSKLTVIECIVKNWDNRSIFLAYGFRQKWSEKLWNDDILNDLASGRLDMAIYNKNRCQMYNKKADGESRLHILRDVCSSMGGRNFYILASKKGIYNRPMMIGEFRDSLGPQTKIAISVNSDRYDNFLRAVGISAEKLQDKGVQIIDFDCDTSLDCFKLDKNILLVGGQDVRMWAEKTDEYVEVINYESFPLEEKRFLYEQSINSIVVGERGCQKLLSHKAESMIDSLMLNFYKNISNPSRYENLLSELAETVKTKGADEETINYILQRILFETYRIQV